jgi:hypothetical protein
VALRGVLYRRLHCRGGLLAALASAEGAVMPKPTWPQLVLGLAVLGALVIYACWLPRDWAVAGVGQIVAGALKGLAQ